MTKSEIQSPKMELQTFKLQRGAALIVVLSFLVLLSLIVSTIVVLSKSASTKIIIEGDRITSGYLAEGAAARLQWLLMDDIKAHPNSNALKRFDSIMNDNNTSGSRKYMANGAPVSIPYYDASITVRIYDMCSGLNIGGGQGVNSLKQLQQVYVNTPDLYYEFKVFINRFTDYIGTGFGQTVNGLGKAGYNNLGLAPLPRNGQIQYRDEILWIPGSQLFFYPDDNGRLSIFDVIANDFYANQVNFFSASKLIIMALCNYSDQDAQYIIEGRDRWFGNSNLSLYDFIDQKYMSVLRQKFSFQDSGNYTFVINAAASDGSYERELIISLKVATSMQGEYNQYYEYILY
ncbi:MAG TPA: hypothetical protein DD381_03130 [Lentisphaeria bacterium]|nr:MAG: hypothetical protein A2X47_03120 [Lentisphaerae bacterium GWF2_38_69]HBM15326.1 hypothetical protein [Lentisphaeria bacterium]